VIVFCGKANGLSVNRKEKWWSLRRWLCNRRHQQPKFLIMCVLFLFSFPNSARPAPPSGSGSSVPWSGVELVLMNFSILIIAQVLDANVQNLTPEAEPASKPDSREADRLCYSADDLFGKAGEQACEGCSRDGQGSCATVQGTSTG
jgi:hypothetical protein